MLGKIVARWRRYVETVGVDWQPMGEQFLALAESCEQPA